MRSLGVFPEQITPLDRLAYVGRNGIGALTYRPEFEYNSYQGEVNLDTLSGNIEMILEGESSEILQELIAMNGSSTGARPKVLVGISDDRQSIVHGSSYLPESYSPWMVKFASIRDNDSAGAIEYVYSLMAKKAGIEMPETHLFPAKDCAGYFAVKRFDLDERSQRLHKHTACGLLHSDFRVPTLDYSDLLKLTGYLCKDFSEVEKIYRLAVFNVLSCNQDDHSKNFAYLMDRCGNWKLSPAYDLTFSLGLGGEQSTMVLGKGKDIGKDDLKELGRDFGIPDTAISEIIENMCDALSCWGTLAKEYGVSSEERNAIAYKLNDLCANKNQFTGMSLDS